MGIYLFIDFIEKYKSSGKAVVFKSLGLAFQGSSTNTGAAGPIAKAMVKSKSKKAVD